MVRPRQRERLEIRPFRIWCREGPAPPRRSGLRMPRRAWRWSVRVVLNEQHGAWHGIPPSFRPLAGLRRCPRVQLQRPALHDGRLRRDLRHDAKDLAEPNRRNPALMSSKSTTSVIMLSRSRIPLRYIATKLLMRGELVRSGERALQGLLGEEQVGAVELDRRISGDHTDDGCDAPISEHGHALFDGACTSDRLEGVVHASSVIRITSTTGSTDEALMMSVAPNARARSSLGSSTSTAIIVVAPLIRAA